MANWRLFIDETGRFDRDSENVAVVGWMVRWDDEPCRRWTTRARVLLETALEESLPSLRYPPHAGVLSWQSAFLAAWMLRNHASGLHGRLVSVAPSLALLEADVRAGAETRCTAFCAAIDDQLHRLPHQRRLPAIELLAPVDPWLDARAFRRADLAAAIAELRSVREDWALLSRVAIDQLPLHANEPEVRCYALAAVSPAGSWPEEQGDGGSGDRYLDLLVVLFERMFHLLRAERSAAPVVDVRVLERNVTVASVTRPLSVSDVEGAIALARQTRFKSGSPDVTVNVHGVNRWDDDTHACLVIADQLAWRLRRTLTEPNWYRLRGRWAQLTETPIEQVPRSATGDPKPLPSVAVSGSARSAVEAAFATPIPTGMARVSPRWAREQASHWVNALPSLTG